MKKNSHHSLFSHLVLVFVIITVLINVSVFTVFRHFGPPGKIPWKLHLERYAGYIINELGDPPLKINAEKLAKELNMEISYLGNKSQWTTSEKIPSLKHLKDSEIGHYSGGFYKIQQIPSGRLVFWIEGPDWVIRSTRHIGGLILFFSLVFFLAGWVLRKLLRPIKELEKSFVEVSHGNFDARMQISGPREFHSTAEGFNSMVKQISEIIESRDTLLRDMSHEFRSPLARIKLAVEMMPQSEEQEAVREDIIEMEHLTTDILDAYRYTQNNKTYSDNKPVREVFNISEVVSNQVTRFKKTFYKTGFIYVPGEKNISVMGDREKIKRLISNLLENAVKHNEPDTEIKIELTYEPGSPLVVLQISDKGQGISEKHLNNIFEPFYRIEEARTRGSGYGLGLFLSRQIARAHNGDIKVLPNNPRGTIFEITLPAIN